MEVHASPISHTLLPHTAHHTNREHGTDFQSGICVQHRAQHGAWD